MKNWRNAATAKKPWGKSTPCRQLTAKIRNSRINVQSNYLLLLHLQGKSRLANDVESLEGPEHRGRWRNWGNLEFARAGVIERVRESVRETMRDERARFERCEN